jgi:GTP-binding protein SAR1
MSYLWGYVKGMVNSVLGYLGLYNKKANIVFLGLDNAGKSALLHVLKTDRVTQTRPTIHPHSEELKMGNLVLNTYDLGGHETARKIWKDYFPAVNAILFLVDSVDVKRFPEAYKELNDILETPELVNIPIAILGNKIDMAGAVSIEELKAALHYDELMAKENRPMEVFMTSVTKKIGFSAALEWISSKLPDE